MKAFPGFSPDALTFLRQLKRNNRKGWFQPRQQQYESLIKVPMMDLACCLSREFARFAPDYVTPPDKSVFRIYRDAHFAHGRKPYQTHIAAAFARHGAQRLRGPCFYFHFTDSELLALGGAYAPTRDELPSYRTFLAENYREFQDILNVPGLRENLGELHGEPLKRMPNGICPNHPAAGLIQRKQWYLVKILDVSLVTSPRLLPELARSFEAMAPFVNFLGRPFATRVMVKRAAFGGCNH